MVNAYANTEVDVIFFCLHNNYSNFILKLKLKVLDSPWSPEVILRPHLPAILCIAPWKCKVYLFTPLHSGAVDKKILRQVFQIGGYRLH